MASVKIKIFLITTLIFTSHASSYGIFDGLHGGDVVEFWIKEQYALYDLLKDRTLYEAGTAIDQNTLKGKAEQFKNIEEQLDKYTKAFDVLGSILETANIVLDGIRAVSTIKSVSKEYYELVSDYADERLAYIQDNPKRIKDVLADSVVINRVTQTFKSLSSEVTEIWKPLAGIAGLFIATNGNPPKFSLEELLKYIDDISYRLQNIARFMCRDYASVHSFILQRRFWYRPVTYKPVHPTRRGSCESPLARWRTAAIESLSAPRKDWLDIE